MPEPKIVEHESSEEIDGGYAYYDSEKHEIHILKPGPLYQRVLEHEQNHAHHSRLVRIVLAVPDSQFVGAAFGLCLLAIIIAILSLAFIHNPLVFPYSSSIIVGILIGTIGMVPLSMISHSLEEFFAEHATRAKARQARRNRGQDTGASSPMPEDYLGP